MKGKKKIRLFVFAIIMGLLLCSCAESSSDKMARLEKEAAEAQERARQSREDYEKLERLVNTINESKP